MCQAAPDFTRQGPSDARGSGLGGGVIIARCPCVLIETRPGGAPHRDNNSGRQPETPASNVES